jgi:hypothetical protein
MTRHERLHHRRQFDWTNPLTDLEYIAEQVKSALQPPAPPQTTEVQTTAKAAPKPSQAATLVSVVYVTASPTFNGPVAGYTTIGVTPSASSIKTASTAQQSSSALVGSPAAFSSPTPSSQASVTSALQAESSSLLVTSTSPTPSAVATSSPSSPSEAAASSTASSDVAPVSQASTGMSGGAKAGVAIGVILILVAVLAVCGFFYRRRKLQKSEEYSMTEDEKHNPFSDYSATPAPVQQQTLPMLNPRTSSHIQPEMSSAMATNSSMDLEKAQGPIDNNVNPFGQHAELPQPSPQPLQEIPAPLRIKVPSPEANAGLALAAGAVTEATIIAHRHNAPQPQEVKRAVSPAAAMAMEPAMPSPAGTEFSMNSASPSTMARGPAPTNVHRVQLDFKPSMDDELELRAGQLVRLLHEYDDGWVSNPMLATFRFITNMPQALCMRLDRSAQGVVPRTCLSARPVKPRTKPPGNPPPGMRLPVNPVQNRPMSPAQNPGFPPGPRSMSPGPYGSGRPNPSMAPQDGRMRSNSAGNIREMRAAPVGPSPMNPIGHIAAQAIPTTPNAPFAAPAIPTTPNAPFADSTPPKSPGVNRKPVPGRTM